MVSKTNFKDILGLKAVIIAFGETQHGSHDGVFKDLFQHNNGLDGILFEGPIDYQPSTDHYLATGKFDKKLEQTIRGAAKEGKDIRQTMEIIFGFARKNHLPIVNIDSSKTQNQEYQTKSEYGYYFLKGKTRDEDMFNNINKTIKKSHNKWYLIGGSAHIKYGAHFRNKEKTLGERLKEKFADRFYNICPWQIPEKYETRFFNTLGGPNVDLNKLMEKYGVSSIDENGNRYFDGYIVHH